MTRRDSPAPPASLRSLQDAFMEAVYRPDGHPLPGLTADSHLIIYRKNLVFGVCEALASTFPLCAGLLGRPNFNWLCRNFLSNHPLDGNIDNHGATFARYIEGVAELRELPFLTDIAQLEWSLDVASRTEPRPVLTLETVRHRDATAITELPLVLQPSLSLLRPSHRIFDAWSTFQHQGVDGLGPDPIPPGTEHLVIWNDQGLPMAARVSHHVAHFIDLIGDGTRLGDLHQHAAFAEESEAFTSAMTTAFDSGWLVNA